MPLGLGDMRVLRQVGTWQDDFALVLMEDANGESISLTEGLPSEKHFKAG